MEEADRWLECPSLLRGVWRQQRPQPGQCGFSGAAFCSPCGLYLLSSVGMQRRTAGPTAFVLCINNGQTSLDASVLSVPLDEKEAKQFFVVIANSLLQEAYCMTSTSCSLH